MREERALLYSGRVFLRSSSLALLLSLGCGSPGPTCDGTDLAARLAAAPSGSVVSVGDCEVSGHFVVPEGVTLQGTTAASGLTGDRTVAVLRPGSAPTILRSLRVRSRSELAVLARPADPTASGGSVEVRSVAIVVEGSGLGLGAERLASLTIADTSVHGPGTPVPEGASAMTSATHGLVISDVASATLTGVRVDGFGSVGALLMRSATTWEGGEVGPTLRVGVLVEDGRADLRSMAVHDVTGAPSDLVPAMAIVASGAQLDTSSLEVRTNERYGVVQSSTTASHVDLFAHDNGDVGVWAQDSTAITIEGATRLVGNSVAGLVALDAPSVVVRGAMIEDTARAITAAAFGVLDAGDGVHASSSRGVVLDGVSVSGCGRAQVVVDLGGLAARELMLTGVTVDGSGTEFGVVAQGAALPSGWDSGVTRLGATMANDAARTSDLSIASAAPSRALPPPGPAEGVNGIVMPVD